MHKDEKYKEEEDIIEPCVRTKKDIFAEDT